MGFIRKIFGGNLEADDIKRMKDEKDLKGLIMAMGDPFTDIRSQATDALGEIGDPQAIKGLIITAGDSDSVLSYKAEEAMVKIGEPAAGDLIHFLQTNREKNLNSSELRAKTHVISALGHIGGSQVVDVLIEMLDDDYAPLRYASVVSLGNMDDGKAMDALYGALEDKNMDVRKAAKKELKKRGIE